MADPTLLRSYPLEDCGCPAEEWIYQGVELYLHFEPNGDVDVFANAGDWTRDFTVRGATVELGRAEAFAWVDALPTEEEYATQLRRG